MPAHQFPLADFLGLEIDLPSPGTAIARLVADERHHNPFGAVHGAVICAMVDTAMGGAVLGLLEPGDRCATRDVQLRFLRGVSSGPLRADVTVLHHDSRRVALDARVTDAEDELVALATGEFAILPA